MQKEPTYRWYILALAALTNTLAIAAPTMCMPVLFPEVAADLDLTLVQIGLIWGLASLPGIFSMLFGGVLGDRFGPKRILIIACLTVGIFGALRGFSFDFFSLAATMILYGVVSPLVVMNTIKVCGLWFSSRQLGVANGVLSMGMALGFLLSTLISATVLSPWLGGWRGVLFLYGGLAFVLAIPWVLTRPAPVQPAAAGAATGQPSIRKNLAHIARIRNIWLLGITIFGISGCVQGALGYLPLYLRSLGWQPAAADTAVASFHTISLLCVIPIALGSDRLGTRKKVLLAAGLLISAGVGLLSVAAGAIIWIAILMAGFVRDGFMGVFMTSVIETEGIGAAFAGTATGMVMVLGGLGNLVAPPLGNSLAAISPALPFALWSGMALLGMLALLAVREKTTRRPVITIETEIPSM